MIICHKYKFIFIKTRKTAGTSIDLALSSFCDQNDIIALRAQNDELGKFYIPSQNSEISLKYYGMSDVWRYIRHGRKKVFRAHSSASFIKDNISPDIWDSYFKFCFERNPWDKVISDYYWNLHMRRIGNANLHEFVMCNKMVSDFGKYTINNEIAVDFIGKYENLEQDLEFVRDKLRLPDKIDLPYAKSGIRKDYSPYQKVFSEEERRKITEVFSKEICTLGYSF
jgi:hypothetical protein